MSAVAIEHRQAPHATLFGKVVSTLTSLLARSPIESTSIEGFAAMVKYLASGDKATVSVTVRPVCVEDAPRSVGKCVGGIGSFDYFLEFKAIVSTPAVTPIQLDYPVGSGSFLAHYETDLFDVETVQYSKLICTRDGSRTGVSDSSLRESAENTTTSAVVRARTFLENQFRETPNITILG